MVKILELRLVIILTRALFAILIREGSCAGLVTLEGFHVPSKLLAQPEIKKKHLVN
jgi:hypothetical protein